MTSDEHDRWLSGLTLEWIRIARESAGPGPYDQSFSALVRDHRMDFPRMVVVGAIVDGGPRKPGVLISSLTDEGDFAEVGCSEVEHAQAIVNALAAAYPGLLRLTGGSP